MMKLYTLLHATYICEWDSFLHGLEMFLVVKFVDKLVCENNGTLRCFVVFVGLFRKSNKLTAFHKNWKS